MIKVKDFIDFSESLYSSIDIRSIIIQESGQWNNIFTLIKFTINDSNQVTKEHELLLKKIKTIDDDRVKICMKSVDVQDTKVVFEELNNGIVSFDDIKSILVCKDYDLYELLIGRSFGGYMGELSNYKTFKTTIRDNKNILTQYHSKLSSLLTKHGFTNVNHIFPAYFNLERYDFKENVIISSPIHCTIQNMLLYTNYNLEANIKISHHLANGTSLWVERILKEQNSDKIIERRNFEAGKVVSIDDDKFLYLKIDEKFDGLKYNETLKIKIINDKLGELTDETLSVRYVRDKTNKFNHAFSLFESYNILWDNLIDSTDDVLFEKSISWIFELFDYKNAHLGKKGEVLRDHATQIGSADIILYNSKSKYIYVVDCTISPPRSDKIDKIRNLSESVAQQIQGNVRPILVCSRSCLAAKRTGSELGVTILDKDNLLILKQLIINDEQQPWILSRMLDDEAPSETDGLDKWGIS